MFFEIIGLDKGFDFLPATPAFEFARARNKREKKGTGLYQRTF